MSASLIVVVVVVVAAAAYFLLIGSRGTQYALPACNEFPPAAETKAVIQDRAEDLEVIRQIDPAIGISVTQPCPDDPDRGALLITVPDSGTADQVSEAMKSLPGLGVPSTIERE
ncbi:hypothetical protein [Georgenia yuyongxinii]